ncbi:hypothetical protein RJ55_06866 [Drechmeria coniospora]|nr:hypothetical protein RJ55_06866 [Drechmeria coniospora]
MPASKQNPAASTSASPRSTAKYTNKDGSKFITVPKGSGSPTDSSQPSTPTNPAKAYNLPTAPPPPPPPAAEPPVLVNRKKQKRRQKAAAKSAAEQAANGHANPAPAHGISSDLVTADDQDLSATDDEVDSSHDLSNEFPEPSSKGKKAKKKKKKRQGALEPSLARMNDPTDLPAGARGPGISRDKIWSTGNHEERERIKEFWLGLGEDERKSLVKVEKDAVLRKMKEQQKHTCSCTVCGRKRTAIEEELEGLYDAYYLELEQFANQGDGPPMLPPPPRDFPIRAPRRLPSRYPPQPPSHGRIVEQVGDEDDEDLEEVYSEGEGEGEGDDFSDDEPPEEFNNPHDRDLADFLTFGNSLQVKGGILSVADDLLKNDGKRFIEMMEQLAERRMAREEDAREHLSRTYGHPDDSYAHPHNHPPPEEDEYEDEEDEEDDYDDSQDDEYEDEEDQMTEEQRMEEGRRMFQIFAARMFEQRVLSAYKEKVAKERQQKLLEELEEESRQVDEQRAKKAKSAQKKKDKAAQKKQALAEEKARREAEKANEEAARLAAEQQKLADQKQRSEEKRRQKEAQRKAEEEARLKKEADRQRRIHEQREKQAEQERKAREAKEREKKLKDEQRQREQEAREQREREAQERKEKQDRDKREKGARAAKAHREAQEATDARGRAKEEKAAQRAANNQQVPKRSQQHAASNPAGLPQHSPAPAAFASPKIPIATPIIPKAPTPIRQRTLSHQQQQQDPGQTSSAASQSASGPSQNPSPHSATPAHNSPAPIGQERKVSGGISAAMLAAHAMSPQNSQSHAPAPGHTPPFQVPSVGMQPPPGLVHQRAPGFPGSAAHDAMFPLAFRPAPGMMIPPPGMNGPGSRGFPPMHMPPPGFSHGPGDQFPLNQMFAMSKDATATPTHARQGSVGYDSVVPGMSALPIGRPTPIRRPGSISQERSRDEDEGPKRLGSRALLEDDEPLPSDLNQSSLRNHPPGFSRPGFAASPYLESAFPLAHNPWGPPVGGAQAFPPPPGFGNAAWASPTMPAMPPGFSVGSPAGLGSMRASVPRHVAVRLMLCQACQALANVGSADMDGYVALDLIHSQIETQSGDPSIMEQDLLNLCDTEGSGSNGGGSFDVKRDADGHGKHLIRWVPDVGDGTNSRCRAKSSSESGQNGSPSKRKNLLERIGITTRSTTPVPRSNSTASVGRAASSLSEVQCTLDDVERPDGDESVLNSKVDTWEGFFEPRGGRVDQQGLSRRYHSDL